MFGRGVDPRDETKNNIRRKEQETQRVFEAMHLQDMLRFLKERESKDKRKRDKALKAFLSKFLGKFKSACSKNVSAEQAATISAIGNGLSHGDTAKDR